MAGHHAAQSIPLAAATQRERLDALHAVAADAIWLRPLGLLAGGAAAAAVDEGLALPLAGGGLAFSLVEILGRRPEGAVATALSTLSALDRWAQSRGATTAARVAQQLASLTRVRPRWAGLSLDRPLIMGVVNVTPDSFSDGGDFVAPERAIAQGQTLVAAGADILDIGGESTRPGAKSVPPEEEIRRVEPVVRALAATGVVVSIDTRHAATMAAALAAGARAVNDVSALAGDPHSLAVIARSNAAVALMHMQGDPQTMQASPSYELASLDILQYLAARVDACVAAGIDRARLVVDPGIGFGKRSAHNLEIMSRLSLLHALGCGVLLGVSRKSLFREFGGVAPKDRMPGSLAGALQALAQGVQILRVHDVAETRQAVATWQAIAKGTQ